jgi:hypothetical protein
MNAGALSENRNIKNSVNNKPEKKTEYYNKFL